MRITASERQRLVKIAARYMDKHYPDWWVGVTDYCERGKFNILSSQSCVIGAGTGRAWRSEDAAKIARYVARAAKLPFAEVCRVGLTSSSWLEGYWLAEAFTRRAADKLKGMC